MNYKQNFNFEKANDLCFNQLEFIL